MIKFLKRLFSRKHRPPAPPPQPPPVYGPPPTHIPMYGPGSIVPPYEHRNPFKNRTSSIKGTVIDLNYSRAVTNVVVRLVSDTNTVETITGMDGRFQFMDVPAGTCNLDFFLNRDGKTYLLDVRTVSVPPDDTIYLSIECNDYHV